MEFKVNIGDPKSKKTVKKVYADDDANPFMGKKIGMVLKGDQIGFPGYEFEITGGSDYCGFPMRKDVNGIARKKVFTTKGFGNKIAKRKGLRYRRTVAGNTIFSKTAQINMKVVKAGKKPLVEEASEAKAQDAGKQAETSSSSAEQKPKPEEKKEDPEQDAEKEPAKKEEKAEDAKEKKETAKEQEQRPEEKKPEAKPAEQKKEASEPKKEDAEKKSSGEQPASDDGEKPDKETAPAKTTEAPAADKDKQQESSEKDKA